MTDLITIIKHEMETDEEDSAKRSQRLESMYAESPDLIDAVCINLCGWTMTTILKLREVENE